MFEISFSSRGTPHRRRNDIGPQHVRVREINIGGTDTGVNRGGQFFNICTYFHTLMATDKISTCGIQAQLKSKGFLQK